MESDSNEKKKNTKMMGRQYSGYKKIRVEIWNGKQQIIEN